MGKALLIWLASSCALAAQGWAPPPHPTGLPSRPFFIRNVWYIGGAGSWDTMTVDPSAAKLYIAHGPVVQVVDIQTGTLAGEISGLAGAYAIALDDKGVDGFISDSPARRVEVFDRRSLQTIATVATQPDPRSLVYEPLSGLVFVVATAPPAQPPASQNGRRPRTQTQAAQKTHSASYITVIDPQTSSVLGSVLISGQLGYAQADGAGQVYVAYSDRNAILRFNAQAVSAELHSRQAASPNPQANNPVTSRGAKSAAPNPPLLDWTAGLASNAAAGGYREIRLGPACGVPHQFALDGRDARLFAVCAGTTLEVLNTATGQSVTTLPIGSAVDEAGYDPVHGYIFAADGAGDGNLTIITRNSATDAYSLVQNLPTRQRAYVMAVDPESGGVYLVTDISGADLSHPGGIGTLRLKPVNGSFQVIEIGN